VLGLWAYKINYTSRSALLRVEILKTQIKNEEKQIRTLKAEWEFLNRPRRLRKLAEYYYEDLRLIPISPRNFVTLQAIPTVNGIIINPTKVKDTEVSAKKKN
jgi:hypothetical protein